MNKRITTAVIIAAAALLLGISAVFSTCIIANNVTDEIKMLRSGSADAEALEQFVENWEIREKILSCYTRHSEIENISSSVSMLKSMYYEDDMLFELECQKIISAAHHLKETEIPYLRNIL